MDAAYRRSDRRVRREREEQDESVSPTPPARQDHKTTGARVFSIDEGVIDGRGHTMGVCAMRATR